MSPSLRLRVQILILTLIIGITLPNAASAISLQAFLEQLKVRFGLSHSTYAAVLHDRRVQAELAKYENLELVKADMSTCVFLSRTNMTAAESLLVYAPEKYRPTLHQVITSQSEIGKECLILYKTYARLSLIEGDKLQLTAAEAGLEEFFDSFPNTDTPNSDF